MRCLSCLDDLDHCHEPLLTHADGTTECLDAGCAADPHRHEWRLSCSDGGCDCERRLAA